MNAKEKTELADRIADAVIRKLDEREKINMIANIVLARISGMQQKQRPPSYKRQIPSARDRIRPRRSP
jgi:hypothetical protein